jgi:predicted polyphosphate/ATP-dependent NAD kinase
MEQGTLYIIGSGTTCRAVTECLELPKTLLGVDVVLDKKLVASDVTEKQLLDHINSNPKNAIIIVTPIGGQGYIFGRGNQQLSAEVIRMVGPDKVKIIATPAKIHSVPNQRLRVDTGDPEIDQALRGPRRILTGAYDIALLEIV